MDYTSWCDEILAELATWLGNQPYGLYGHLDTFTEAFLSERSLPLAGQEAVASAVLDVFGTFGLPDDDKRLQLKYEDLNILTNSYGRWQAIFNLAITDIERLLLGAINRLSISNRDDVFWVSEVRQEQLLQDPVMQSLLKDFPEEHLEEMLDQLSNRTLIHQLKWIGVAEYKATY